MAATTEIKQFPLCAGEDEHWINEYNSLPNRNKQLIEFIVDKRFHKGIIKPFKNENSYGDNLRKILTSYDDGQLLALATKTVPEYMREYTARRVNEVNGYEKQFYQEVDEVKFRKDFSKQLAVIEDKYIDKYLDVMFRDELKAESAYDLEAKKSYKKELIKDLNISGIKARVLRSIDDYQYNDSVKYKIIATLNDDAFKQKREAPLGGWRR